MNAALKNYAHAIVQAHTAAAGALQNAVAQAVRAGELLLRAKAELPHGAFGAFCANLPFGETTARGYMRLAALDPPNRQRVAEMPLRAALQELAEPRTQAANHLPAIIIPLGSFGLCMWRDSSDTLHWFEAHPAIWPDGVTIGMHYATATMSASGAVDCYVSRRAPNLSVAELAEAQGAPLARMQVLEGEPVLWTSEVAP